MPSARFFPMLEIVLSNKFRKDLRLAARRGYDLEKLNEAVEVLAKEMPLPEKFRDHELIGDYAGFRECHIQPDWLLVYRYYHEELILFLLRTGTHSDLF